MRVVFGCAAARAVGGPRVVGAVRAAITAGSWSDADALLEPHLSSPTQDFFALCLRAELAVKRGEYDQAASDLRLALGREPRGAPDPWRAWARYELGYLTSQYVGSPQQALEFFDAALAINPRHYKALQHRGHVHAGLGRLEAACADLCRALACWPSHVEPEQRAQSARALVELLRSRGFDAEAAALEQAELGPV